MNVSWKGPKQFEIASILFTTRTDMNGISIKPNNVLKRLKDVVRIYNNQINVYIYIYHIVEYFRRIGTFVNLKKVSVLLKWAKFYAVASPL